MAHDVHNERFVDMQKCSEILRKTERDPQTPNADSCSFNRSHGFSLWIWLILWWLYACFRGHDTVGAVALDSNGNLACATSTGGITAQQVGRVSDSPLPGSGGYADNDSGSSTILLYEWKLLFCVSVA